MVNVVVKRTIQRKSVYSNCKKTAGILTFWEEFFIFGVNGLIEL